MTTIKTGAPINKQYLFIIVAIIMSAIGWKIYSSKWPTRELNIGVKQISVLVADTEIHRIKGLGDRKNLGNYGGMLFVFDTTGQHAMWMKGMRFPLDIVWIDGSTIIDMAPNVPIEPGYADAQLTPYFSRLPSNLVLELPAGFLVENGVKIGDKVEIE